MIARKPASRRTAASIIEAVRDRGNDPRDFRDAVHEAAHALEARVPPPWDRERIHTYLVRSCGTRDPVAALVDSEIRARSAEMHACRRYGIEYAVGHWALAACLETLTTMQACVPLEIMVRRIQSGARRAETRRLVDRIEGLR